MLEIVGVRKNFVNNAESVLDGVSVQIQSGEFFSLLGPSGCGKTTLLRIIAGLETPDAGRIVLDGQDITTMPPQDRPFHMVFQKHALFPHMTVADNVAFGLRFLGFSRQEVIEKVKRGLALVQLESFADRYPETLSGGQGQRVALARALVCEPRVLLLDEPLSALDQKMKESMQTELRVLQKRVGITFICVTHDQQEAFALSDRVAVMSRGRFEQLSSPAELYLKPATAFSAQFVGSMVRFPVQRRGTQLECQGEILNVDRQVGAESGGAGVLMVRPENIRLGPPVGGLRLGQGLVREVVFRGLYLEVLLEVAALGMISVVVPAARYAEVTGWKGQSVDLSTEPSQATLFWEDLGSPKR